MNLKETILHVTQKGAVLNPDMMRESLTDLAKVGLNWHPDDPIEDIRWSMELDEEDIKGLVWIDNLIWATCNKHDLDIYDEMMNADVRAHGKASPFYRDPEELH